MKLPDIDIDTRSDFTTNNIGGIRASRIHNKEILPHSSGYYFDNIPVDNVSNLSAIPYKEANTLGYFKVDFLHNKVYDMFDSRDEIKKLIEIEPDWTILENEKYIKQLPQIHNHFNVVRAIKPKSINDLADVLALIRPGKRHLLVPFTRGLIDREELYTETTNGYRFRKSHSIAYAYVVSLAMHSLKLDD